MKYFSELDEEIARCCDGLTYISETDAPIVLFSGQPANTVTREAILQQSGLAAETCVEEFSFDAFFERLTADKEWYGDRERERAKKYPETK